MSNQVTIDVSLMHKKHWCCFTFSKIFKDVDHIDRSMIWLKMECIIKQKMSKETWYRYILVLNYTFSFNVEVRIHNVHMFKCGQNNVWVTRYRSTSLRKTIMCLYKAYVAKHNIFGISRSIPCIMIPLLFASPGHQQLWNSTSWTHGGSCLTH